MPDVDLMNAKRTLGHYEQQADRLDREITALEGSQHRRASHLVAHRAEQVELDAIDDVLGERLRQHTNRVVQDPPSYITKALGSRPLEREMDRTWVRAVVEVEQYRQEYGVTGRRTMLGPEPADRHSARAWSIAVDVVADAAEILKPAPTRALAPQPSVPAPSVAIEGPSLDIGF